MFGLLHQLLITIVFSLSLSRSLVGSASLPFQGSSQSEKIYPVQIVFKYTGYRTSLEDQDVRCKQRKESELSNFHGISSIMLLAFARVEHFCQPLMVFIPISSDYRITYEFLDIYKLVQVEEA